MEYGILAFIGSRALQVAIDVEESASLENLSWQGALPALVRRYGFIYRILNFNLLIYYNNLV